METYRKLHNVTRNLSVFGLAAPSYIRSNSLCHVRARSKHTGLGAGVERVAGIDGVPCACGS